MKKPTGLLSLLTLLLSASLAAQPSAPWSDPSVASEGKADPRPEFISYASREQAEDNIRDKAPHYVPLDGKWRVNVSTTEAGGEPGFYKPGFPASGWQEADVPNLAAASGASPLLTMAPPQLPDGNPLVQYRAAIDIPYLWLDRDIFLHVEGVGSAYALYVNDKRIGFSNDSRTPAEYLISDAVTDGINSVGIEVYGYSAGSWMETLIPQHAAGSLGKVYLYSQPKLRIEDFVISAKPDSARKHGYVHFAVVMSNSYRSAEKITLGYDIYSPAGKLLTYNLIEREIPGQSTDTIYRFEILYSAMKTRWTPQTPTLYKLMLFTRRDGRITEYIPLRFGFKGTEVRDGELWIDDRKAELNAVDYDATSDASATEKQIRALKSSRVNTVCVSYPQPEWFYDLCDRVGMYVIDQANINGGFRAGDRNVGGSVANDPAFLPQFIERTAAMQGRSKNHTSVIALSLGGHCGNGYNFYKAYRWLKEADSLHYVTYRDAGGEWNSDFGFPQTVDAKALPDAAPKAAAAKPKKTAARR